MRFGAFAAAALVGVALMPHATAGQGVAAPTFTRDIAPIFYKSCTVCHHPGELAPMSLMTYSDARPWARAIRDQVSRGTMPPWHADPAYGHFQNDRRLSDADKSAILGWVDAGAPEGDANQLPAAPQ